MAGAREGLPGDGHHPRGSAVPCKSGAYVDTQHRQIRTLLTGMAPRRAVEAVRAVGLPPDEETCIIDVDILGRSCLQTAARLNLSLDGLYKLRRRAYAKLADDIMG